VMKTMPLLTLLTKRPGVPRSLMARHHRKDSKLRKRNPLDQKSMGQSRVWTRLWTSSTSSLYKSISYYIQGVYKWCVRYIKVVCRTDYPYQLHFRPACRSMFRLSGTTFTPASPASPYIQHCDDT
jgi:hypothetical protein